MACRRVDQGCGCVCDDVCAAQPVRAARCLGDGSTWTVMLALMMICRDDAHTHVDTDTRTPMLMWRRLTLPDPRPRLDPDKPVLRSRPASAAQAAGHDDPAALDWECSRPAAQSCRSPCAQIGALRPWQGNQHHCGPLLWLCSAILWQRWSTTLARTHEAVAWWPPAARSCPARCPMHCAIALWVSVPGTTA